MQVRDAANTVDAVCGARPAPLLDEVWACLREAGITSGRRNVMLYREDVPNCPPYSELGAAHRDAVPVRRAEAS